MCTLLLPEPNQFYSYTSFSQRISMAFHSQKPSDHFAKNAECPETGVLYEGTTYYLAVNSDKQLSITEIFLHT